MASQVTVTGSAGPDITVTAKIYNDVKKFAVDTPNNILEITDQNDYVSKISITDATTFTVTKSGSDYTVEVS